jgi:tetratricopeptide (TPR) repeat protein/CHAT domain-containing protein
MFTIRASRMLLVIMLWSLLPVWLGQTAGQEQELTPQGRKQLESEAKKLDKEALSDYQQRKYGDAIRCLEQSLTIWQKLYPNQDHPELAANLNKLGLVLTKLGQPGKALPYYERALAMRERLYPKLDHPILAADLDTLGNVLEGLGQPAKALPYYERALAMRERLYPKQDHLHLAASLTNLGNVLERGQPAKALPYHERALAMRERLHPKQDHPDLVESLNNLGNVLRDLGQPAKALPHLERALALCERLYPKQDHRDLAASLSNLGNVLRDLGQPARALPHLERALALCERLYPKQDHPDLAGSLNNLGAVLLDLDQPAKALPHLERALAMRERLYPKQDHLVLATSQFDVGRALQDLGQPGKALNYYERALSMWERLYPNQDDRDRARILNNLGNVLRELGQPAKALPHLERALALCERLYPKQDHAELARGLNNLGVVLQALGQPAKALPYYERSLAMRERLHPKQDHRDLPVSQMNLGAVLSDLGQPAKALPHLERALALCEHLYPKQHHRDLAASLSNLGTVQYVLGESAKALPFVERALAMDERLYANQDHPNLARSLHNLAGVQCVLGESAKALPYAERGLAMCERLYPKQDHPELAGSLNNLGIVLRALGQPAQALPHLERALAMYRNLGELAFLDETQALSRAAVLAFNPQDAYLSVTRDLPTPETAYPHIWKTKAIVTRTLQDRRAAVRFALTNPEKHMEFKASLDELLLKRGQRAFWFHNSVNDPKSRDQQIRLLTDDIEKLERQLGNAFPDGPRRQELAKLGPADLAKGLPGHTAFIDLIRYTHYEKGKPPQPRYVAFLLSGAGNIHRVELEAAADIDLAVDLWRQAVSGWSPSLKPAVQRDLQDRAAKQATALRQLVWEPLAPHLPNDTHTVHLAPDGNLARFPFAALPGRRPGTILLEELTIAYAPHGPALLERLVYPPPLANEPGNALVVGGIKYDATGGQATALWHELKATAQERDELKRLAGKRPVVALSGPEASVARLTEELPKARYAHLATHGFFKEDEFAQEQKRLSQQLKHYEFAPDRVTHVPHQGVQCPLVFAGLVLAGANAPAKAGPDGGLLVAETIGNLPLEGLRLAVLSACDTGLGEQTRGEAVQSLQLAFHLAGCPDVIASLWQVNDGATAVLMAKFYHELWVKNRPPIEALRQAQLLVYLRPDLVAELASDDRGPPRLGEARRREILERGVDAPASDAQPGTRRTPTKLWAAFVLSGTGQ